MFACLLAAVAGLAPLITEGDFTLKTEPVKTSRRLEDSSAEVTRSETIKGAKNTIKCKDGSTAICSSGTVTLKNCDIHGNSAANVSTLQKLEQPPPNKKCPPCPTG